MGLIESVVSIYLLGCLLFFLKDIFKWVFSREKDDEDFDCEFSNEDSVI